MRYAFAAVIGVHYAYHPCDDALASIHELAGRHWQLQPHWRILRDEITSGRDELDGRGGTRRGRPPRGDGSGLSWLGEVDGVWGDWTPLKDPSPLFPEPGDPEDPWQFPDFRVT